MEGKHTVLDQPPDVDSSDTLANFTVSPDDRTLALSAGRQIFVYDLEADEFMASLTGHSADVTNLFFKNDGSEMYSLDSSDNWIMWDTSTWTEIEYYEGVPTGNSTILSPDGTVIATTYIDEIVFLDARTFEEIHRFTPHLSGISDLAFSDEGKRIVTGSSDGTVRVWGVPR